MNNGVRSCLRSSPFSTASIARPVSPKCENVSGPFERNLRICRAVGSATEPKTEEPVFLGDSLMLAEKFILLLETVKSHAHPDGSPRVISTSPHIPAKLPNGNRKY